MHRETEQRKGTHLLGNHTGVGDHEHMGMWAPWTQDVGVGLTRVVIIEQEGGLFGFHGRCAVGFGTPLWSWLRGTRGNGLAGMHGAHSYPCGYAQPGGFGFGMFICLVFSGDEGGLACF